MARDIDPKNLSGGDVARILAPLVGFLVVLIVVGKYAPQLLWVLFAAMFVAIMFSVRSIPKKNLEAIAESRQKTNDKIKNLPVLGAILYPLWRVFGWLSELFSVAMILLIIYLVYIGAS